ncbi:MAG TPA: glycosyltransferase family 2 protein [Terriglobales bacterium]|nr:glycosyltransferase family 2 protein [Terriglobales bacterium]
MAVFIVILFWFSVALVAYVYIGYPLLISLGSGFVPPPNKHGEYLPRLTLIIPARNEEQWIRHKLENTLELDYPKHLLEIIVASDGSTDQTVAIASGFQSEGVAVAVFVERQGKQEMLNILATRSTAEILVMTDTHVLLERASIRNLVRHFADAKIGCVTGQRLCILQPGVPQGAGEGMYWRYESWIKRSESRMHSCLGAHGQLYAVRRSVFPHVERVGEDFYIPMKIIAATGMRVLFEPGAIAHTPAAANLQIEFERKTRAHVSFLMTLPMLPELLVPWRNPVWWQYISHHLLRMTVPIALGGILVSSFLLAARGDLYWWAAASQLVFYLLSVIGFMLAFRDIRINIFYIPFYFVLANASLARALLRWPRKKYDYAWNRTERIPVSG